MVSYNMHVPSNKSTACYHSHSGSASMDTGCENCIWFRSGRWSKDIGHELYSKHLYLWTSLNKNLLLKLNKKIFLEMIFNKNLYLGLVFQAYFLKGILQN